MLLIQSTRAHQRTKTPPGGRVPQFDLRSNASWYAISQRAHHRNSAITFLKTITDRRTWFSVVFLPQREREKTVATLAYFQNV
jgi:hypothetical protein